MEDNWHNKSIEALEHHNYGDPTTAPTSLMSKCLAYVKLSIGSLSIEQTRLLIGQGIGLEYLIPYAFEFLDNDILAEGDYYPGDLLKNVATVDVAFWKTNPGLYQQLNDLITKGRQKIAQEGLTIISPDL